MEVKIFLSSFDLDVLLEYRTLKPDAEINVLLSYGTVNGDYYDMIVTHRDKINDLILVLRRLKWNSLCDEVSDGGGDQVDHGDEVRNVPVTSGSGASCLEETVEALESCVGVP